ncbi:MAG: FtsQ-type POTRA domain-containing protein [Pseudomonadota bacterium]
MGKRKKNSVRRSSRQSERPMINWREVLKLMVFSVVVVTLVWVARGIEDIPIKTIEVASTLNKVNKDEIRSIAANYYSQGFFTAQLADFEKQLNSLPWVYKANIKRKWPYKLVIKIEEQQPVFRWGDEQLLNRYANTFDEKNLEQYKNLPKLYGIRGREEYLARLHLKYNKLFNKIGMRIVSLEEDARYDKVMILDNGIKINIGKENIDQQLERCLLTFPKLKTRDGAEIVTIDLRHSNGFAVRWNG